MSADVTQERIPSLSQRVAEEIRALLARRQIRQAQLARELGVSEQWISVRLRGVQPIDLDDLERIAKVLKCRVIDLLPPDGGGQATLGNPRPGRTADQPNTRPRDNRPSDGPGTTAVRRPNRRSSSIPAPAMTLRGEGWAA